MPDVLDEDDDILEDTGFTPSADEVRRSIREIRALNTEKVELMELAEQGKAVHDRLSLVISRLHEKEKYLSDARRRVQEEEAIAIASFREMIVSPIVQESAEKMEEVAATTQSAPTIAGLLGAFATRIESKIDVLAVKIDALAARVGAVEDRVAAVEDRLAAVEERVAALERRA